MMSPIKNVALVNELGQVVNHVVVDTEDTETIDALHEQWGTHRHVETKEDDTIILDPSPEIWTTHCDDESCETKGFNIPDEYKPKIQIVVKEDGVPDHPTVKINGRLYPADSLLIKENASKRPDGWTLPEGVEEVSLTDKE